jgi:predicted transcriptional regulator
MPDVTKRDVIELIEKMPDDARLEDILYELYVRSEIEHGLSDLRNGRTLSHEEVMRSVSDWLQSAGR